MNTIKIDYCTGYVSPDTRDEDSPVLAYLIGLGLTVDENDFTTAINATEDVVSAVINMCIVNGWDFVLQDGEIFVGERKSFYIEW